MRPDGTIRCDCPRCGSRSTKALPVLHQDRVRHSQYRRRGSSWTKRGWSFNGSTTRGVSMTRAAQIAAPPVPALAKFLGVGIPTIPLLGALIDGWPGVGYALIALVVLTFMVAVANGNADVARMKEWGSSFRCGRCGPFSKRREGVGSSYDRADAI